MTTKKLIKKLASKSFVNAYKTEFVRTQAIAKLVLTKQVFVERLSYRLMKVRASFPL